MTAKEIITKLIDEQKITGEEAITLLDAINTKSIEIPYVPVYLQPIQPLVPYYVSPQEPQKFEITCMKQQ